MQSKPQFKATPDKRANWKWQRVSTRYSSVIYMSIGNVRVASVTKGMDTRKAQNGELIEGKFHYLVGPVMAFSQPGMPLITGRGECENEFDAMKRCEVFMQEYLAAAGLIEVVPGKVDTYA